MKRPELEPEYTVEEVAAAIKKSPRWLRNLIKAGGCEVNRYGAATRFTASQVAKLRADSAVVPIQQSITTGRKRRQS